MKAQNLTISIPNKGCDKNCPYCISRMTGFIDYSSLFEKNIEKLKTVARAVGINNILLTGKGEPLLNKAGISFISSVFKEYPLELQTNGQELYKLFCFGGGISAVQTGLRNINTIAISIDNVGTLLRFEEMIRSIAALDFNVRITYNLSSLKEWTIEGYGVQGQLHRIINICKNLNVKQLTFRKITIPTFQIENSEIAKTTAKWISKHIDPVLRDVVYGEIEATINKYPLIRELAFGAKIHDVNGIAMTSFPYCIQDTSGEENIRSLIYQEDGHLYTSWNSKASILF